MTDRTGAPADSKKASRGRPEKQSSATSAELFPSSDSIITVMPKSTFVD